MNLLENFVKEYLERKGFLVFKITPHANSEIIKDRKGECDFIITKRNKKIYVEVKAESNPKLTKEQIEKIEGHIKNKEKVWIFLISRTGGFLIFEVKENLELKRVEEGFIKQDKNKIYKIVDGCIKLLNLTKPETFRLERHKEQLRKMRRTRC